jgi:hypothetical protein
MVIENDGSYPRIAIAFWGIFLPKVAAQLTEYFIYATMILLIN